MSTEARWGKLGRIGRVVTSPTFWLKVYINVPFGTFA